MPLTVVFRVRGLPHDATTSDLQELARFTKTGEQLNLVDELVVPSCPLDDTKTGLFGVRAPVPGFLKRLENCQSETFDFALRGKDVEIDRHFGGFTQLYPTPLGRPTIADIVALTGLNGHAYGSWKGKGNLDRMWLRHFFSEDFPACRTMIYGYNADLRSKSKHVLLDFCRRFLTDLQDLRRSEEDRQRPLIFVGHSYGGLLVAHKSLVKAKFDQRGTDHPLNALIRSTVGILFFGTPHRGMLIENLLEALDRSGNAHHVALLEEIKENCSELEKDLERFIDLCNDFEICSFYETGQTQNVVVGLDNSWARGGEYRIAVENKSAILHLPGNMEKKIPVDRDHSTMIKFKTNKDCVYSDVRRELHNMISEAPSKVTARFGSGKPEYQIPPYIPFDRRIDFTGRSDELCRIHGILRGSDAGKKIAVLHGMGGAGKTEIAIEYANRNSRNYSSIWWINCARGAIWASTVAIAQELFDFYQPAKAKAEIAPQFGYLVSNGRVTNDHSESDRLIRALSRWFKQPDNSKWLLILDDVNDLDHFDRRLLLPGCPHGALIITSRREECARNWPPGVLISELPKDDGVVLFQKALGIPASQSDLSTEIVTKLGFLPLAIVQARAYINSRGVSLKRYLEIYERNFHLIWKESPNALRVLSKDEEKDKEVYTTWKVSLDQVQAEDPQAAHIFMMCAFISGEGITARMLELGLHHTDSMNAPVEDHLKVLFSYYLAKRQAVPGRLCIHPLVHRWTRECADPSTKALLLADTFSMTCRVTDHINSRIPTENRPKACSAMNLFSHIEALTGCFKRALHSELSGVKHGHLVRVAQFCYKHGRLNEASDLYVPVVETRKRVLGEEHPNTLTAIASLASIYCSQGRLPEAEKLHLPVVEARRKALGEEHPLTLASMSNLAWIILNRGRLREAEELYELIVETSAKAPKVDHPSTLTSMSNLAWAFFKQGQWEKSEKLGVQVTEARKRVLGENHTDTLISIANLASTYRNQGRLKQAEELDVQVLEKARNTLGQEHPLTLTGMANLASTYQKQGRLEEANELHFHIWEKRKYVVGLDHPDTLSSMDSIASIYGEEGKWEEAEKMYAQAAEKSKRVLGEKHPDTLDSVAKLALASEARELQAQAIRRDKAKF